MREVATTRPLHKVQRFLDSNETRQAFVAYIHHLDISAVDYSRELEAIDPSVGLPGGEHLFE